MLPHNVHSRCGIGHTELQITDELHKSSATAIDDHIRFLWTIVDIDKHLVQELEGVDDPLHERLIRAGGLHR